MRQMLVELLFPRIGIFGDLTFCVQIKAAQCWWSWWRSLLLPEVDSATD